MTDQPTHVREALRRIHFLREAGAVERCHQTPHHGPYNIAIHSFNALNLILVLHPAPSLNLLKAITWHDAHERLLGDIPAPTFWASPTLTMEARRLEEAINQRFGIDVPLTPEEGAWLRAVDKLELWLWAKEQLLDGNHRCVEFVALLDRWFATNRLLVPGPVSEFIDHYRHERTPNAFSAP